MNKIKKFEYTNTKTYSFSEVFVVEYKNLLFF